MHQYLHFFVPFIFEKCGDIFASLRAVYAQALLLIVRIYLKGHFFKYTCGKIFLNKMISCTYTPKKLCIIN